MKTPKKLISSAELFAAGLTSTPWRRKESTIEEKAAISHLRGVQLLNGWLSNEMACSPPDEKQTEIEDFNKNLI